MSKETTDMKEATAEPGHEPEIPRAIGAASLTPERRRLGVALALCGLIGFFLALVSTTFVPSLRIPGAVCVPIFFLMWKVGKTILRGNLDRL